jgi:hypothetical protein
MIEDKVNKTVNDEADACCCGPATRNNIRYTVIPAAGKIQTEAGEIDVVPVNWVFRDYLGWILVRLNINRMEYAVKPGLYAVGKPDRSSPVLVTANYKLSFDVVRKELAGLNAWLMAIDTKGINVWCAAGKGTFGTMELIKRIGTTGLEKVVDLKRIILPQLGAPGVAAHIIRDFTGFWVLYGPVRASDIKKYLDAGMKADTRMRRAEFGLLDRLAVSWLEAVLFLKILIPVSFLIGGAGFLLSRHFSSPLLWNKSVFVIALLWVAAFTGSVLNAALLPYIPGKAFSFKGSLLGAVVTAILMLLSGYSLSWLSWFSVLILMSAVSGYIALNYTGSSTFTSRSGVDKELKYALPVLIGMAGFSVIIQAIILAGWFL